MKNKKSFLNFLFLPRGQIIIVLLLFSTIAIAQEQTPPKEFVLDAAVDYDYLFIDQIYDTFIDCGFNTMTQRSTNDSKPKLDSLNLHALNMQDSLQLIYWYSSAYYSKWEAEEDQPAWNKVGVKHSAGQVAYWNDNNDSVLCWTTKGISQPVDTIVYGPTYHQEKWYRRWLYQSNLYNLQYTPRFRMALDVNGDVSPNEDVCRIYVILKYRWIVDNVPVPYDDDLIYPLKEAVTLKVSDFPPNGAFDYIYFSNNPDERSYEYPSWTRDPVEYKSILPDIEGSYFQDKWGGQGVQFCIDWLRTDTLCTLYIDNIEVYDNNGWNIFLEDPFTTSNQIKAYADSFKTLGWTNIKHWVGGDEPFTIDSYIPIRTVDSLLRDIGAPPLMVHVYPYWNVKINEDSQLVRYYKTAKPDPLNIHFFPFISWFPTTRYDDWEAFRNILQISYTLTKEKGFWYKAQNFGTQLPSGEWSVWRQPDSSEHKAEIMLSLAHGVKGLTFSHYDSYPQEGFTLQGFIGLPPAYDTTDLWYMAKNNIIPRLKGKFGKTLKGHD